MLLLMICVVLLMIRGKLCSVLSELPAPLRKYSWSREEERGQWCGDNPPDVTSSSSSWSTLLSDIANTFLHYHDKWSAWRSALEKCFRKIPTSLTQWKVLIVDFCKFNLTHDFLCKAPPQTLMRKKWLFGWGNF